MTCSTYACTTLPVLGSVASVTISTFAGMPRPRLSAKPGSNSTAPWTSPRRNSGSRSCAAGSVAATRNVSVAREPAAQLERHGVRRRIHDGEAHVIDVGADRVAEDDDLDDRHQRDDGQRPPIAQDVVELFPQQAGERRRLHRGWPGRGGRPSGRPRQRHEHVVDRRGAELLLQLGRRADRANPSGDHDRHAVAVLGFVHVVRGHEHGRAFGGSRVDELPELTPGDRVHAARRLVQEHDARLVQERDRERELLPPPERNRSHELARGIRQAEPRQHAARCARESARW